MFFIVWFISGIICFISITLKFVFKEEEIEDKIADLTWETGVDRETIKTFIYILSFVLGIALIPMAILSKLYEWITGKKFFGDL